LQELLVPASVEFFSAKSKKLGSKITLEQEIHEITEIPIRALQNYDLRDFSFEERMSWVTGRKTTVGEDRAYCLLGIFGVFLPPIYGEGEEHALRRMKVEIRNSETLLGLCGDIQSIPGMLFCSCGSDAGLILAHAIQPLNCYYSLEMNSLLVAKKSLEHFKNSFVRQVHIIECLSMDWEAVARQRWFLNWYIR
jgi:hypothetical protein